MAAGAAPPLPFGLEEALTFSKLALLAKNARRAGPLSAVAAGRLGIHSNRVAIEMNGAP